MTKKVGRKAQRIVVSTDNPIGGHAIPVYVDDTIENEGNVPFPIYQVSQAELDARDFTLQGGPAIPISAVSDLKQIGGKPIPVFVVSGSLNPPTPDPEPTLIALLNDQFTTPVAAEVPSPHTAEPTGSWKTQVDSSDRADTSIAGGELVFTHKGASSGGSFIQHIYSDDADVIGILAGKLAYIKSVQAAGTHNIFGWMPDNNNDRGLQWRRSTTGISLVAGNTAALSAVSGISTTDVYHLAILRRNEGGLYYIKPDGGSWSLAFVDNYNTQENLRVGLRRSAASGDTKYDNLRVYDLSPAAAQPNGMSIIPVGLDLAVPGTGTGTSSIAAPAVGNTFVISDNFKLTYTFTTLDLLTNVTLFYTGSLPRYQIRVTATGDCSLRYENGGSSALILGAGAVSSGSLIEVTYDHGAWELFVDGVSLGTASHSLLTSPFVGHLTAMQGASQINNLTARTLDVKDGLVTDILPGPLSEGDTFTHTKDCFIEFDWDELSGTGGVWYRTADSDNHFLVKIEGGGGNLVISRWLGGVFSNLATAPGVVGGGEKISLYLNGSAHRLYYDSTLALTITDSNFLTATVGKYGIANGNKISDLVAFDQPIDGTSELELALAAVETG